MKSGTIISFYSYKGGVGRTMALANVAALMATWGFKVLCLDWDLEAPGLQNYFQPWLPKRDYEHQPGIVESLLRYQTNSVSSCELALDEYSMQVELPDCRGELSFVASGQLDEDYLRRLQSLNWTELYQKGFGHALERWRESIKSQYDFILIDSRTGITDTGGICTIQLPDLLVLLFTANRQSLDGCLRVARSIDKGLDNFPFDRSKLSVLPVPTRFETRVEYRIAQEWMSIFATELQPLYDRWLSRRVSPQEFLVHTRIPQISFWSFGERLPVIEKGTLDPEDLGYAFETLAALLAQKLDNTELLVAERDAYVRGVSQRNSDFEHKTYDIFLSHSTADRPFAQKMSEEFRKAGLRVFFDSAELTQGNTPETWSKTLSNAMGDSRHVVLVLGPEGEKSHWLNQEAKQALELSWKNNTDNFILPVLRRGVESNSLPKPLQAYKHIAEIGGPEDVAQEISRGVLGDRDKRV